MASTALLRIHAESERRWRVSLSLPAGRTLEGLAEGQVVDGVRGALGALRAVRPPVVPVGGLDTNWCRAEEDVGRALVRLIRASEDLAHHYAQLFGRPDHVVVAVDAEGEAGALPWELLAAGPDGVALEATQRGAVLRVGRGIDVTPEPAPEGLEVVVWCPTPDDEVCARLMSNLDGTLEELGQARARRIDPTRDEVRTRGGHAVVLHVVCHGRRDADAVSLVLGGEVGGASRAAARLGLWLSHATVVILDVCDAGADVGDALETLPGRLLACGARACVAPSGRLGSSAATAFGRGFYRSWLQGNTLAEATARGRREVAALGMALADSRWHNLRLTVADVRTAVESGPRADQWRPAGWPRPARDAQEFLLSAYEIADSDGHGFVGLEHFAQAIVTGSWRSAYLSQIRVSLGLAMAEILSTRRGLSRAPQGEPWMGGTPRLERIGRELQPGFTLEQLWRVILADGTSIFAEVASLPSGSGGWGGRDATTTGRSTFNTFSATDTATVLPGSGTTLEHAVGAAAGLMVVGGAEDGRELWPAPGDHVGRTGMDPGEVRWQLYGGSAFQDKYLHRDHFVWEGPGRINSREACRIQSVAGRFACRPGEVHLRAGELLVLTEATRLRGLPVR